MNTSPIHKSKNTFPSPNNVFLKNVSWHDTNPILAEKTQVTKRICN